MEQSPTQLQVIDLVLGKKSIQTNSDENALAMIKKLIEFLPEDIASLEKAYHDRDRKQLLAALHKIRGGLFYCGVPRLTQQITIIHAWMKNTEDVAGFSEKLDLIKDEYTALKLAYEAMV